jgi:hypothetical protein
MNIELAKQILISEINQYKQYWTLKRKVLYKLKNKRK